MANWFENILQVPGQVLQGAGNIAGGILGGVGKAAAGYGRIQKAKLAQTELANDIARIKALASEDSEAAERLKAELANKWMKQGSPFTPEMFRPRPESPYGPIPGSFQFAESPEEARERRAPSPVACRTHV